MKTLIFIITAISAFAGYTYADSFFGGGGGGSSGVDFSGTVTGVNAVANGGTNSSTALNNNRVMTSQSGAIKEATAITANRLVISDSNGIPATGTGWVWDSANTSLQIPDNTTNTTNLLKVGSNGNMFIATEISTTDRMQLRVPSGGRIGFWDNTTQILEYTKSRALFMDQSGANSFTVDLQPGKNTANVARACGIVKSDFTDVGNVGGGTDTLMTWTRPANYLSVDGSFLRWHVVFDLAANANAKQITCTSEDGTTVLDTTSQAANDGFVVADIVIQRTGSASTRISSVTTSSNSAYALALPFYTTGSDTLSGTAVMACQGTATADNDIVQKESIIEWCPGI